jgi:hypothetical protein
MGGGIFIAVRFGTLMLDWLFLFIFVLTTFRINMAWYSVAQAR